jgi:ubiquinone/menaquinone biosynthesis C-methylase UbiE
MRRRLQRLNERAGLFLDVGCGKGEGLAAASEGLGLNVIGIDIFEPYLKIARQRGFYRSVIKGDVRFLPFTSKSFDHVICMEVIEHLTHEEGRMLISELERVARRTIVLTTPGGFVAREEREGNVHEVHRSGWIPNELKTLGYRVIPGAFRYPVSTPEEGLARSAVRTVLTLFLYPLLLLKPSLIGGIVAVKELNGPYGPSREFA